MNNELTKKWKEVEDYLLSLNFKIPVQMDLNNTQALIWKRSKIGWKLYFQGCNYTKFVEDCSVAEKIELTNYIDEFLTKIIVTNTLSNKFIIEAIDRIDSALKRIKNND